MPTSHPHEFDSHRCIKGWFWIDAPSSVPLELLDVIPEGLLDAMFGHHVDPADFGFLRLLRMFRLLRLLKLLKLDQGIESLEEAFEVNLRFLRIVIMV